MILVATLLPCAALGKPDSSKPLPSTSVIWPKDGPKTYEQATHKQRSENQNQAAADKISILGREYTGEDLFGLTKEQLSKRFPAPDFKHKDDFSQVRWHGTDTSSILDLRFKDNKVAEVRLSTHYGYPRPGTTSDVEIGQWLKAKQQTSK